MSNDAPPVQLEYKLSPGKIYAGQDHDQAVRLMLSVRASDELRRSAAGSGGLDLCLLLDVSGSMDSPVSNGGPTKLQMATTAVKPLLNRLKDGDTMTVVTFANSATIVADGLFRTDEETYMRSLEGLTAFGGTAMGDGLRTAAAYLNRQPKGRIRKILMLTDGHAGDGDAAPNAANEIASDKVSLDVLGLNSIEADFALTFCEQLVASSGGFATLITSPEGAEREFRRLLATTLDTVASGLRLKLKFPGVIRATDAYRGEPENVYLGKLAFAGTRETELPLGLLERTKEAKYYVDLIVPSQKGTEGQLQLCLATLSYEVPGKADTLHTERNVIVQCVNDRSVMGAGNSQVDVGYNIAYIKRLERDLEKVRVDAKAAKDAANEEEAKKQRGTFAAIIQEIIKRCASAGMIEQKKHYEELLNQAERGELPDLGKINIAVGSTTRVSNSSDVGAKLRHNPFAKR